MSCVRVKNFSRYQHYKHRRPPWIRLYRALLDDPALMRLQDASKWLAVGLLLVASQCDNHIVADAKWLGEVLHTTATLDLEPLVSSGFIERCDCQQCASEMLASCKQNETTEVQKYREQRTETPCSPPTALAPLAARAHALEALPHKNGTGTLKRVVQSELAETGVATGERSQREAFYREAADLVFAFWIQRLGHKQALLDDQRRARIVGLLRRGSTLSDLLWTIEGAASDDWVMGRDPRSPGRKDTIDHLFRNRGVVEKYAGRKNEFERGEIHPLALELKRRLAPDAEVQVAS